MASLLLIMAVVILTITQVELMAERAPVLFDQDAEAFDCPVVWVETLLGQATHLSGAIPAVRAVDENVRVLNPYGLNDHICCT